MKERLDVILVKQGLAPSREKAKAVLMAGNVFVNGQREDKAGTTFDESKIHIEIKGSGLKYVSRGGLKLEKAMAQFPIALTHAVCMDIGASTGGFTDCMLQSGAGTCHPETAERLHELSRDWEASGLHTGARRLDEIAQVLEDRRHGGTADPLALMALVGDAARYTQ